MVLTHHCVKNLADRPSGLSLRKVGATSVRKVTESGFLTDFGHILPKYGRFRRFLGPARARALIMSNARALCRTRPHYAVRTAHRFVW